MNSAIQALKEESVIAALDTFYEGREPKNVIEIIVAQELEKAGVKPKIS